MALSGMANLSSRGGAVLIVEDDALLMEPLAHEFEGFGYDVTRASSGDDAIGVLRSGLRVDLLVTDVRLPGASDGWAVAEEARRLLHHLPVIYVTGYTNEEPRHVPGSVFIAKPYRPSVVMRAARGLGVHGAMTSVA